jgi:uncharacterized DUF497 family protein
MGKSASSTYTPEIYVYNIHTWTEVFGLSGTLTTSHLAFHIVHPIEAEQVLAGDLMDLDHNVTPAGEERWIAVGQTVASRVFVIVWTILEDGAYRAVTAYPATKGLGAVYFRLTKGE